MILMDNIQPWGGLSVEKIRATNILLNPRNYNTKKFNLGVVGEPSAQLALLINPHYRYVEQYGDIMRVPLRAVEVRGKEATVRLGVSDTGVDQFIVQKHNSPVEYRVALEDVADIHHLLITTEGGHYDLQVTLENGEILNDEIKNLDCGDFTVFNGNKSSVMAAEDGSLCLELKERIQKDLKFTATHTSDLLTGKFMAAKIAGWNPETGKETRKKNKAGYISLYQFSGGSFSYNAISLKSMNLMNIFASGLKISSVSSARRSYTDENGESKMFSSFSIRKGNKPEWNAAMLSLFDSSEYTPVTIAR